MVNDSLWEAIFSNTLITTTLINLQYTGGVIIKK